MKEKVRGKAKGPSLKHTVVLERMRKDRWRPADLARELGVSRQLINYIIYRGGGKYAAQLARVLRCNPQELLTE